MQAEKVSDVVEVTAGTLHTEPQRHDHAHVAYFFLPVQRPRQMPQRHKVHKRRDGLFGSLVRRLQEYMHALRGTDLFAVLDIVIMVSDTVPNYHVNMSLT